MLKYIPQPGKKGVSVVKLLSRIEQRSEQGSRRLTSQLILGESETPWFPHLVNLKRKMQWVLIFNSFSILHFD